MTLVAELPKQAALPRGPDIRPSLDRWKSRLTGLLPFLLPKMHERFFFLADVLALAFVALRRDRLSWAVFLLVETASVAALLGMMFRLQLPSVIGGAMILAAILILGRDLLYDTQVKSEREAPQPTRFDLA